MNDRPEASGLGSYWEHRLRGDYDERGVGDIGLSRSYNSRLYDVRRRVFRRLVSHLPVKPSLARVLDIGSGTGVYIDEWQRWGAGKVTGSDITRIAVENLAQQFPRASFVQRDIGAAEASPAIAGQYDVISAFDVLFHVVEGDRYRQAIRNIASLLSPGGWFVHSDNLVQRESTLSHFVSRTEGDILGACAATVSRSGAGSRCSC